MTYKTERLKKLNEYLIPEALENARQNKGDRLSYDRVIMLCKERDDLEKGGLRGLLAKIRRLDRFAIVLPLALILNSCATKDDWRDFRDGYIHLFSHQTKQSGYVGATLTAKGVPEIDKTGDDYIRGER